ncbi:putative nuclear transport factor 2 domain protein [Talaromyces proteolyticus]|uniref:Nuclear transport factor 2 domain protein n=1 Tax=Talaromyces proteolyticus TaxID=1131652 RepID=A0AAD4KKP4_9EURO|nr:putative nuclear transport factor 2 domain protein [Talaromyces proteolyticus]KAH8693703.1 putative nuclear transport factor 2 domain protein [Talaromyces proteolyticus]
MAVPKDDLLTKVSTEGATDFVQSYHSALSTNKKSIASFYSATPTNILFNGNVIADGAAVEEIFTNQLPSARYDINSFDSQIINKAYPTTTPGNNATANAKNVSMLVVVSGSVQYGAKDSQQHGFSETFVLIPNVESKEKNKKDWIIQSQNFRLVA